MVQVGTSSRKAEMRQARVITTKAGMVVQRSPIIQWMRMSCLTRNTKIADPMPASDG